MIMANLIKRIAVSTSHRNNNTARVAHEFASNLPTSGTRSCATTNTKDTKLNTLIKLLNYVFNKRGAGGNTKVRVVSFKPRRDQIKVTKDIIITNDPAPGHAGSRAYVGEENGEDKGRLKLKDRCVLESKSVDDLTEGGSVKSDRGVSRSDSDDEELLVSRERRGAGMD